MPPKDFPDEPKYLLHKGPWLIADTIRQQTLDNAANATKISDAINAQIGAVDTLREEIKALTNRIENLEHPARGRQKRRIPGGAAARRRNA